MGNRFIADRIDHIPGRSTWKFTKLWCKPNLGHWYKRLYSKSARRWQDKHERGLRAARSECHYRRW